MYKSRDWRNKATRNDDGEDAFQSVDGAKKLYYIYRWGNGERWLDDYASASLTKVQKSLVAKQDKLAIALEYNYGRGSKLSQVPYRECVNLYVQTIP